MEVKVSHIGKTRFQIRARQHIIDCDQPVENGGDDAAMTPPEIFLASLGSCAAFYAAQFLSSRKLADHGLEVLVVAEKLRDPARLGNFVVKVQSPVTLTADQTVAMERSVHRCLIHQTMLQPPQIAIEIVTTKEPAMA
ncbi:MAG: OsmC family protein [Acidobacteriaceae bacterium]